MYIYRVIVDTVTDDEMMMTNQRAFFFLMFEQSYYYFSGVLSYIVYSLHNQRPDKKKGKIIHHW